MYLFILLFEFIFICNINVSSLYTTTQLVRIMHKYDRDESKASAEVEQNDEI